MSHLPTVLVLSTDLWFVSRIRSAAAERAAVETVRRADLLAERCRAVRARLVLVDMNGPDHDWSRAIEQVKAIDEPAPVVVAFGPHVDLPSQARARDAGADRVLSNQRFTESLPALLDRYLASDGRDLPESRSGTT